MLIGWVAFFLMGLTLGVIGGGGSILTVPILVYIYGMKAQEATGSSLFVVGATALVGALISFFKKEIQILQSLPFAIPSVLGVFVARTFLLPAIPEILLASSFFTLSKDMFLMICFSFLMLTASLKMIRSSPATVRPKTGSQRSVVFKGFSVGLITGFVGAGGGFLIIPALIFLLELTMRQAVATSLMIIAINSAMGFLGDLLVDPHKDWYLLFTSVSAAILGLLLGRQIAPAFSEKTLKRVFGWFVLVLGGFILFEQLH